MCRLRWSAAVIGRDATSNASRGRGRDVIDYLITGNRRHFPDEFREGIAVVNPREFLAAVNAQTIKA